MALPMRRGGGDAPERRRPAWTDPFGEFENMEFENMWSEMGKLLEQACGPAGRRRGSR